MNRLLKIRNLEIGFESKKGKHVRLHHSLNFELTKGQFISILGPNGAGKSTFLRTILAYQKALFGDVYYGESLLTDLTVKELAKEVAVVLTDKIEESFLTVYEIVSTGRYPFSGFTGRLTETDNIFISEALELVENYDDSYQVLENIKRFYDKIYEVRIVIVPGYNDNEEEIKKTIYIGNSITVKDFAKKMEVPTTDVISKLMENGILATINEEIDLQTNYKH